MQDFYFHEKTRMHDATCFPGAAVQKPVNVSSKLNKIYILFRNINACKLPSLSKYFSRGDAWWSLINSCQPVILCTANCIQQKAVRNYESDSM